MTYEELMHVLRNEDGEPYPTFTLQDYDGNEIRGEELYVLDAIQLREWKVDTVLVRPEGLLIRLNSGNFKSFHFRNVY